MEKWTHVTGGRGKACTKGRIASEVVKAPPSELRWGYGSGPSAVSNGVQGWGSVGEATGKLFWKIGHNLNDLGAY